MMQTRAPRPPLVGVVKTLWASARGAPRPGARERVLPTGDVHLALRLDDVPLRLFDDPRDPSGFVVGCCVVGGARAAPYLRDVSAPTASVGAQLTPSGVRALFGVSAAALAGRHTELGTLWGADAARLRRRLAAIEDPGERLDAFEAALASRLVGGTELHPAVVHALARFETIDDVATVARETGWSTRRLSTLFFDAVGLSPKVFARVARLQRTLPSALDPTRPLAVVAADCGFSDQAHLTRELRTLTGLTPATYRRARPLLTNHVPLEILTR